MDNNFFGKVFGQIVSFMKRLSPMKQIGLAVGFVVVIGGMVMLFAWAGKTNFVTLRTNLSAEDAAAISRLLRDKHIPYEMDAEGKTVFVTPDRLDDLRLELSMNGIPNSSAPGYELFDKQTFGTTSFVQKINQKRALEGELMRSIASIKGIRRSRVHLATPQKSTFVEDQKKTTASVVLDLEPGFSLTDRQIYGIGNLVAKGVDGLDVQDVTIVDSSGKQLSKNNSDPMAAISGTQFDFRQKWERENERKIEDILSHVVGEGKVVARINADMDFSQSSEIQTTYDPEQTALKSAQRNNTSMEGSRPGPRGVVGAQSNLPQDPNATPGVQGPAPASVGGGNNTAIRNETKTTGETVNYVVSQTVRNVTRPMGNVKHMSVAVMLDGKLVKTTDKDGVVQSKIEAWTPEKLKEFEQIVSNAVGLDKKRGDTLELKSFEFTREDFDEASKLLADAEKKQYIRQIINYLIYGLLATLFFAFVVKPFIRWLTQNTVESVDNFLPQTIEELESLQTNAPLPGMEEAIAAIPDRVDPEKVEGEMIKDKIISLVDQNPHKAALILRDWLHTNISGSGKMSKEAAPEKPGKNKSA